MGHCEKGFVAKVCDFGMARVLGDSNSLETQSLGTVQCMPPELFVLDGAALTPKVDVYAFGILMWMLCSGQLPYPGMAGPAIVVLVARGAVLELPPSVPKPLAQIYQKSVARAPADRPKFESLVHCLLDFMKTRMS